MCFPVSQSQVLRMHLMRQRSHESWYYTGKWSPSSVHCKAFWVHCKAFWATIHRCTLSQWHVTSFPEYGIRNQPLRLSWWNRTILTIPIANDLFSTIYYKLLTSTWEPFLSIHIFCPVPKSFHDLVSMPLYSVIPKRISVDWVWATHCT